MPRAGWIGAAAPADERQQSGTHRTRESSIPSRLTISQMAPKGPTALRFASFCRRAAKLSGTVSTGVTAQTSALTRFSPADAPVYAAACTYADVSLLRHLQPTLKKVKLSTTLTTLGTSFSKSFAVSSCGFG